MCVYVLFWKKLAEAISFWYNQFELTKKEHARYYRMASGERYDKLVLYLLERFLVNSFDDLRRTILHHAAMFGHVRVIETLLRKEEVDVHAIDIHKQTPFALALLNDHICAIESFLHNEDMYEDILKLLAGHPSQIFDLLRLAAKFGRTAMVKKLLQSTCVEDAFCDNLSQSFGVLRLATKFGRAVIVKELLQIERFHKRIANYPDLIFKLLRLAAKLGRIAIVKELLRSTHVTQVHGMNEKENILFEACTSRQLETTKVVLQYR